MIQKKCPLCSQLSLKFNQLLNRFFGNKLNCQKIHIDTYDSKERVREIYEAASSCACEAYTVSKYSTEPVRDSEVISRFVFSPIHIDKKTGDIKPSVFSHAFTKGCSIQRETKASDDEITKFVGDFLALDKKFSWNGVLIANCGDLRSINIDSNKERAFCVYDTAEEANPAHAEFGQSQEIAEADIVELRHDMFVAFSNGKKVLPKDYRNNLCVGMSDSLKSQINLAG